MLNRVSLEIRWWRFAYCLVVITLAAFINPWWLLLLGLDHRGRS